MSENEGRNSKGDKAELVKNEQLFQESDAHRTTSQQADKCQNGAQSQDQPAGYSRQDQKYWQQNQDDCQGQESEAAWNGQDYWTEGGQTSEDGAAWNGQNYGGHYSGTQPSPEPGAWVTAQPNQLSSDRFFNPGRHEPPNIISTLQTLEMTSPPGFPVVEQPTPSNWPSFGMVEAPPPTSGVMVLTSVAAFLSIFLCICTGLPAFVVAIQAFNKKSDGHYKEARQKLWHSTALSIASLFCFAPTILLILVPLI